MQELNIDYQSNNEPQVSDIAVNKIIRGDSLTVLKQFPSEFIDLVLTSPPYFKQRDYGNDKFCIGNEQTQEEYLENLLEIFFETVRTAKKNAILVFNLGDKYLNGGLSLLPYKFAIRAIESKEVVLINQIIWSKLNPTPRQEKRKLIQSTEPFFVFAKSKDYYFNLNDYLKHLDGLNNKPSSRISSNIGKKYFELIEASSLTVSEKDKANKALQEAIFSVKKGEIESFRMKIRGIHKEAYGGMEGGRNNQIRNNGFTVIKILGNALKKDLIESPVEITKDNSHPAVYPMYIIQELIKLLSKENDLILDPFCGSATTCIAAKKLKRRYIGIDINDEYVKLSNRRIENVDYEQEFFL